MWILWIITRKSTETPGVPPAAAGALRSSEPDVWQSRQRSTSTREPPWARTVVWQTLQFASATTARGVTVVAPPYRKLWVAAPASR